MHIVGCHQPEIELPGEFEVLGLLRPQLGDVEGLKDEGQCDPDDQDRYSDLDEGEGCARARFEARLEALESSPLLPRARTAEEAHCQVSEDVSRLGRTFFMLQVPLRVPTSCAAEHVELSWRLRFTFYVVPPEGGRAGEVSLGWELPVQMVAAASS